MGCLPRLSNLDWNQSVELDLSKVAGGARAKNCRPTAGRIEVCNARYGNTGWLGIAQIWASGTHITQAITKLNDTYFNTATYNTPAWRQLVTCQEIAHDFGLDHQDEIFDNTNLGTCMDYTNDPDGTIKGQLSNVEPNGHDYEEIVDHLQARGQHDDDRIVTAVDHAGGDGRPRPRGSRTVGPAGPLEPQRPRADLHPRLRQRQQIVTEVFWADPTADGRGR